MADFIVPSALSKKEKYNFLNQQLSALMLAETNLVANLANFAAVLHETFNWLWTGFYFVEGNELVLGPFQGPVACTRIAFGKGVCGVSWKNQDTIVVDDVASFDGYISCSSRAKSEIVVPVFFENKVVAVLDVDSESYADFDEDDAQGLERLVNLIESKWC
jgi:GAF domain-containing protein